MALSPGDIREEKFQVFLKIALRKGWGIREQRRIIAEYKRIAAPFTLDGFIEFAEQQPASAK